MILNLKDLSVGYQTKKPVLSNISMTIRPGEIWCVLGPNGVGKTTLFKSILGFLHVLSGEIRINDEDIKNWTRKQLARTIGYVPQAQTNPFPFTVEDVIVMGRTSHLNALSAPDEKDMEIVERSMVMLGIGHLKHKIYTELSGGERQMVLIARALTQEPDILMMDEPTSNLDFGNQVKVLEQISYLSKKGMAILMTSHLPDHAFLCNAKVALIQKNKFRTGMAGEMVTEENLKEAYRVNVKIVKAMSDRGTEIRSCVPLLGYPF